MKWLFSGVVLIFSCASLEAQVDRSVFGVGTLGGLNSVYADGGISAEAVLFSHFDVNAGLATRRYQGAGFSFGWRYYPFGIRYFSPVMGVNLMMINGRTFSVLHNGFFSVYSTPKNQYMVSQIGAMYTFGQLDFLAFADYALAKYEVHTQNESGFADADLMRNIDQRINGGLGFTIGVMFRPYRVLPVHKSEFGRLE